jgi:hypothetical protein
MTIGVVLDEIALEPLTGLEGILKSFEDLSSLLERMRADDIERCKHSEVWSAAVAPGVSLFDILFSSGYLDEELRRLLSVEIDRLANWDAQNNGHSSRRYASERIASGTPFACAVLSEYE